MVLDREQREAELLIVGGGILGLACAHLALQRRPGLRVLLVEKERALAEHQTGHNSGVIHSGIYYLPGSLKATLCRSGREALLAFCAAESIPVRLCGKLILASHKGELPALAALQRRGEENGVAVQALTARELPAYEPEARALAGLLLPETGVVDYGAVARRMGDLVVRNGGRILLGQEVHSLQSAPTTEGAAAFGAEGETEREREKKNTGPTLVATLKGGEKIKARQAIVCAGLQSDRVARRSLQGEALAQALMTQIVPFRGEYFRLREASKAKVRGLIYPVPDPRTPFLGVHFTRTIHDEVLVGPNAVLSFSREGGHGRAFDLGESLSTLRGLVSPGALRLFSRNLSFGLSELYGSLSPRAYAKRAAKMLPSLRAEELEAGPCGVRAQALRRSGELLDDFELVREGQVLHVINAPSPAATASLAIAARLLELLDSDIH